MGVETASNFFHGIILLLGGEGEQYTQLLDIFWHWSQSVLPCDPEDLEHNHDEN